MQGADTGVVQSIVYVLAGCVAPAPIVNASGSHGPVDPCWSEIVIASIAAPPGAGPQFVAAWFAERCTFMAPVACTANVTGGSAVTCSDWIAMPCSVGAVCSTAPEPESSSNVT